MTQIDNSPEDRRRSNFFNSFPIDDVDEFGKDVDDDDIAPPAYGELHDQIQLSQSGFEAGAAVTNDGRVNININQKDHMLSDLLTTTISRQPQTLAPQQLPTTLTASGPLPPAYIPPSLGGLPGQTPPPRLNVVIQIVGSRGDVQPFIALGQVLRDTYGHRVRVATHPTFRSFVEENGLEFFSIGGDPAELMAFMVKNPGLMPGIDALKDGEIKRRRQGIEEIVMGCWRSCIEAGDGMGPAPRRERTGEPVDEAGFELGRGLTGDGRDSRPFVADAIVANPPSFAHIHVAEKLGVPLHVMFTMPWSPTRAFSHPLANIESTNTDPVMTNYVSYAMVEMMTWQGLGDVINRFREKVLDLEPISLLWAPGLLSRLRIPTTYCWSPALIPKPNDWGPEVTISGFFFLNLASSYTPDPDLAAFLAAGPPPVYIGFGSIVVDDPNTLTRKILDAVSLSGVRALVSKGWGGLGAEAVGLPEGVFMLGNCPHDWLFQHVSAVVHHGGAGTSAVGIKLGKPTVVVPFFGDQPFWGSMIAKAGAGPTPIPFTKLTTENLAAAIQEALKPETQARAQELGARIREEKGTDIAGKSFHEFLNTDNLRCSLAPSRVAVWRVRRTKIKLSALAGAVLVNEGLLKYSDLKLYRSIEYNTEEQPWDPISAVVAGLVGDLGTMAMAVGDFPREMFKGANWKKVHADVHASKSREGSQTADDRATLTSASSSHLSSETFSASELSLASSSGQPPTGTPSTRTPSSATLPPPKTPTGSSSSSTPGSQTKQHTIKQCSEEALETTNKITLETALGAGRGVSRIVESGMKMPLNVCMGLARGFRNAPRLYSDDTIRPQEKVTDFASGLRIAGKEFGLGMYDGISGLVTQPLRGAKKEGGMGLVKGFGKGIGGLIFKPAAAAWAIPAYTMQGVHAEVRKMSSRSSTNYVITSRVLQGKEDMEGASAEERGDVLLRWQARKGELKGFYSLKQREIERANCSLGGGKNKSVEDVRSDDSSSVSTPLAGATPPAVPPRTGWLHTRHLSWDQRKKLHEEKDAWKAAVGRNKSMPLDQGSGPGPVVEDDDHEFEQAIRASVQQTSRGDREEDLRVEAAIRNSLREMRLIARRQEELEQTQRQELHSAPVSGTVTPSSSTATTAVAESVISNMDGAHGSTHRHLHLPHRSKSSKGGTDKEKEYLKNITDEEYQALIEEAVKQSLAEEQAKAATRRGVTWESDDEGHDPELMRALEASRVGNFKPRPRQKAVSRAADSEATVVDVDEDEQMRRALEESGRQAEQLQRQKTEEDIVLEYVKRQSLAEEQLRRRQQGVGAGAGGGGGAKEGKGKDKLVVGVAKEEEEEEDEDLKRALAMSLEGAGGGGGGGGGVVVVVEDKDGAGPSSPKLHGLL